MMDDINKPDGWPANAIEQQLENIMLQLERFKNDASYLNKEHLIASFSHYDLNQMSMKGMVRTTEYEVACINSLFIESIFHMINALKVYLYELIGRKTRLQKIISGCEECDISLEIKEFAGLMPQLKLYYYAYQKFTIEKNRTFSEQLISVVEEIISYSSKESDDEVLNSVTTSYISLLNDISYFESKKINTIWAFSRSEIYELYKLVAKLCKITKSIPARSPLKGVLMTSISNYILKSRYDYNDDYICKYVSKDVSMKSVENHQIWMSTIEKLNDKREEKVLPEIFRETNFDEFGWINDINFSPCRKYFVSSFCKTIYDTGMMNDYGSCIYGYKNDRIAELLAPIVLRKSQDQKTIPCFSQVVVFDVLYDKNAAKEELRFLCKIIELFDMENPFKKMFLEEILQYWILSVKDSKWKHERERRYVLFLYDCYEYKDVDFKDCNFLKLKTSLFLEPDFILGDNPVKKNINEMIDAKRKVTSLKPYMFCKNCLNRDYDQVITKTNENKCPICGSDLITVESANTDYSY